MITEGSVRSTRFTHNTSQPGAIDAYKELGYEKSQMPLFFGIDGTVEGLNAVKEGELAATVYIDKESQAPFRTL